VVGAVVPDAAGKYSQGKIIDSASLRPTMRSDQRGNSVSPLYSLHMYQLTERLLMVVHLFDLMHQQQRKGDTKAGWGQTLSVCQTHLH
jgi:hypothetical protein